MLVRADGVRAPRRLQRARDRRRGLRVRRARRAAPASRSPRSARRWPPTTPTSNASASGGAAPCAAATRSASASACNGRGAMRDCARERRSVLVWGAGAAGDNRRCWRRSPMACRCCWRAATPVLGQRIVQLPSRPGRQPRRRSALCALRRHRQVRRGDRPAQIPSQQHGRSVPDHRIQMISPRRASPDDEGVRDAESRSACSGPATSSRRTPRRWPSLHGVEMRAVCDVSQEARRARPRRPSAFRRSIRRSAELLESDCDVVHVLLPPFLHEDVTRQLARGRQERLRRKADGLACRASAKRWSSSPLRAGCAWA